MSTASDVVSVKQRLSVNSKKNQLLWLWHFSCTDFKWWFEFKCASNDNIIFIDVTTLVPDSQSCPALRW